MISASSSITEKSPFTEKLASDAGKLLADLGTTRRVERDKTPIEFQQELLVSLLDADTDRGFAAVKEAYEAGYGPDEIKRTLMAPALDKIMSGIKFPSAR